MCKPILATTSRQLLTKETHPTAKMIPNNSNNRHNYTIQHSRRKLDVDTNLSNSSGTIPIPSPDKIKAGTLHTEVYAFLSNE